MLEAVKHSKFIPPCTEACPAGIDVPRYIRHIQRGDFDGALAVIRERIPLPAVCGYACVQPCETKCSRIQFDEAVSIRLLKRAAWEKSTRKRSYPERKLHTGKTVAVVGSGPCGLTAAYYLALQGHSVEVFDREEEPGGMMRYTIPEYRLPEEALKADLEIILKTGITFRGDKEVCLPDISGKYDAIVIATGNPLSRRLEIPGADLPGVFLGVNFLRSVRKGCFPSLIGITCVIGGGNVAIDTALTARRLGATHVFLICLEKPYEMPAYPWEISQAREEGIQIYNGWSPVAISATSSGERLIDCVCCTSVFDKNNIFNPRYDPSVTQSFHADTFIFAIGQAADISFVRTEGISVRDGLIIVNTQYMTTTKGIFAAGEAVSGPSSIIDAIAHGKQVASSIDRHLGGQGDIEQPGIILGYPRIYDVLPRGACRHKSQTLAICERNTFAPVELGYNKITAVGEALRCLACDERRFLVEIIPGLCKECGYCREVCMLDIFSPSTIFNPSGYRPFTVQNSSRCVGCLKCLYICPDFAITVREHS